MAPGRPAAADATGDGRAGQPEVAAAATSGRRGRTAVSVRKLPLFRKDLRSLMYAFGDDAYPANDTVAVLEDILIEYINDMCLEAGKASGSRQKIKVDDFRFALRNDHVKLGRVEELLAMQMVIAEARKQFDEKDD